MHYPVRILPLAALLLSLTLAGCGSGSSTSGAAETTTPANTSDSTGTDGAQNQSAVQNSTQAGPAPGPAQ